MVNEIDSSYILTPNQLKNHIKIYAGPGAGKTHFLVENVKNIATTNPLITQSRMRKILCITYTNNAVNEIKQRLNVFTSLIEVYTIHGFIIEHIINPFQSYLKEIIREDFGIIVDDNIALSSQIEGLGILHGIKKEEIYDYISQRVSSKVSADTINYSKKTMGEVEVDIDAFIASLKNNGVDAHKTPIKSSQKIDEKHILPIKEYLWSVAHKLTHNEILYFGYKILEQNPLALYTIRVKFPFIFVDEFQDTNPLQTKLIELVGEKSTVVGVVGDLAQSIYSFQGAQPSDFINFSIKGDRKIEEYTINNNRRSTENITNFCNFLRQSDDKVVQTSVRPYENEEEKRRVEAKKVHFLIGNSQKILSTINNIIMNKGVVLTRSWAASFEYIQGINASQITLLKNIYNSYYNSPIQIREEITEHNNVTWVRAFRFILSLWEGYRNKSFIGILDALKLYTAIDPRKITPKILFQINDLLETIFSEINDQNNTVEVIKTFNNEITKPDFAEMRSSIFAPDFAVPILDELDNDKIKESVSKLHWSTSYKLFTKVFSKNSKYMTVHQAKGLEWDKVIVSVAPNRFDKINLPDLYSNPKLTEENPSDEFTRLYYVACSRARNDLYIHLADKNLKPLIESSLTAYTDKMDENIDFEFIE